MTWHDLLKSKLATVALCGVLVFVMIIAAKILVQKRTVDREIAKLQFQIEKVKKDNEQLSSLNKYFSTPEYQEKAAREKLNLSKPGEYVVVLPEGSRTEVEAVAPEKKANYKLWFDYFFSHNEL